MRNHCEKEKENDVRDDVKDVWAAGGGQTN